MSSAHETQNEAWGTEDAKDLYMIDRWGRGYFDVSPDGNLTVAPLQERGSKIAIRDVVDAALEQGLRTPLLIRFQDLLHHRVRSLNEAFNKAIAESKFRGTYRGVFPIKVNQLREVVEEILDAGKTYHYGVEVGCSADLVVLDCTSPEAAVAELSQPLYGLKRGRRTFTRPTVELHRP